MYPSNVKYAQAQTEGLLLDYEAGWTILGVSIRTFGKSIEDPCLESFYLIANDTGSVLASITGHNEYGTVPSPASIVTSPNGQVMSFPLAYVTQSPDTLDLVNPDEDFCSTQVHAEVYYIEENYASTTEEVSTSTYSGPNINEWTFGLGVLLFFLSLIAWRYIFRPVKEMGDD